MTLQNVKVIQPQCFLHINTKQNMDQQFGFLTSVKTEMSYPSALRGSPKIIFFTDFDGTITLDDSK